jgi:nitrogenase molybdenum-iron protein alpha/beta subunit
VSSLPSHRGAHLSHFDKELTNLELAEFESQETPDLFFGGSEESKSENITDTQRKEKHDLHGGKWLDHLLLL